MTDKELQKLGRRELLQLLLDQAKETDRISKLLKDTEGQLSQVEEGYERLRERLDHKDTRIHELQAQIDELQNRIQNEKEKRIADLSEVGSIAEAALKLNGVFDAAQRAANQYLRSVKELYAIPGGIEVPIEIEPEPEPEWSYQDDRGYHPPEPPRSRPSEPGRYRAADQPFRFRQYPPEEPPEPEWSYQDDRGYPAPEPPRSRPSEPGRYRAADQPFRFRQYPPEEPPEPEWSYQDGGYPAPEPPRSRAPEAGRFKAAEQPPQAWQYSPEEPPGPEWGYQDDGACYSPEPSRAQPPELEHGEAAEQPPRAWQYSPEELEPKPEGRADRQERERRTGRREESSRSGLPFRVKRRKETGKTTLFFGWQHD